MGEGEVKNLPPELVDRIHSSRRRCFKDTGMIALPRSASSSRLPSSIYSGGYVPYASLAKKAGGGVSDVFVVPTRPRHSSAARSLQPSSHTVVHATENAHWLSRNSVGPPEKTAWMINDKGNRVWFSYEHTPTLFPVHETRFYKPKLHKLDFLKVKKEDSKGRDL